MTTLAELHSDQLVGTLSCFDRVILFGSLPDTGHAEAMQCYLGARNIRLFDYPKWAEPLREELRVNAERLAAEAGFSIEFICSANLVGWGDEGTPTNRVRTPNRRLPPCHASA